MFLSSKQNIHESERAEKSIAAQVDPELINSAAVLIDAPRRRTGWVLATILGALAFGIYAVQAALVTPTNGPSFPSTRINLKLSGGRLDASVLGSSSDPAQMQKVLDRIDDVLAHQVRPVAVSPKRLRKLEIEVAGGDVLGPEIQRFDLGVEVETPNTALSSVFRASLPYFGGSDPVVLNALRMERLRLLRYIVSILPQSAR